MTDAKYKQTMKEITITTNTDHHVCDARKVANWITFRCPICAYVRVMDESTGEMKVINPGDPDVLHSGLSFPTGIDPEYPMS
jgi:hypothetical protein